MAGPSFIKKYKKQIDDYLLKSLEEAESKFQEHDQSASLFSYLLNFCQNGKSIRGTFFLESIESSNKLKNNLETYLPAAAALELIHSGLLIQDDWMDQDDYRRGQISFHSLQKNEAEKNNFVFPKKYSGAATNCATDITFFLAFELLNKIEHPNFNGAKKFIMQEYINVGFAQWQDIFFSYKNEYQLSDIERIYRYKTARYTFVTPIIAGLLAAGEKYENLKKIEEVAENLGMVFQITDDRLNIFGKASKTNKSVGSDISDNKKTYYHFFFHQIANEQPASVSLQEIKQLFGKKDLTTQQLEKIMTTFKESGVEERVNSLLDTYQKKCQQQISQLSNKGLQDKFSELLAYILERQS